MTTALAETSVSQRQMHRVWAAQQVVGMLAFDNKVHKNPLVAANYSVVRPDKYENKVRWENLPELTHKPYLVCEDPSLKKPPSEFFNPEYLLLEPQNKSIFMQGNINLAMRTVFWLVQDRVGTWPSLVDSAELKKLLKTEIGELAETDCAEVSGQSMLRSALNRDQGIEWYLDPQAEQVWDVASEVADLAFCSLQHLLAYDSYDIAQCEDKARVTMKTFEEQVDPFLTNDDLITFIHDLNSGVIRLYNHNWPELILGLSHLLTKRMGVDLWEAITLKCLANERHYPQAMKLVEPDRKRRMDEARTSAWVFAKKTRENFSKKKRFIPPMSDWVGGPTVLDLIYESPYLDEKLVDLLGMLKLVTAGDRQADTELLSDKSVDVGSKYY